MHDKKCLSFRVKVLKRCGSYMRVFTVLLTLADQHDLFLLLFIGLTQFLFYDFIDLTVCVSGVF